MSETKPQPKPAAAPARAEPPAPKRKRLLFVESDGFTRLVLLLQLRLAGFAVDFTSNGSIALAKLRSCRPDVVLVELKLCGLSGLDFIKAARSEPGFANRSIYVFTRGDQIKRATARELERLGTKLLDKNLMTREDVVQALVAAFKGKSSQQQPQGAAGAAPTEAPADAVPPEVIQQIITGVREQAELLGKSRDNAGQGATAGELLSRVSSLTHCAEAARLPVLARQAKALEHFVGELCKNRQACTPDALGTVNRSVQVMSGMCSQPKGLEASTPALTAVVVDEEPASNRALKQALTNVGFTPACFEHAADARTHLASNRAGLIIVNVAFPEGHGLHLREIRQLPLHAETPVVFGHESKVTGPGGEMLSASEVRLDRQPVLLTELVVKALNEVQAPSKPAPPPATAPAKAPAAAVVRPLAATSAAAEDDYVELFAGSAGRKPTAAVNPAAHKAYAALEALPQPFHVQSQSVAEDSTTTIHSNPMFRAQAAATGPDHAAEQLTALPAIQMDNSAVDDQAVQELPPTSFQMEATEARPERTGEDHAAASEWVTAAAGETDRSADAASSASESQALDPAAVQEAANSEESMDHQSQAIPAEYAQESELNALGQVPSQPQTAEERCAELERQLASFRQAFANFSGGLDHHQQQATTEAEQRVKELEQRAAQAEGDLEKLRAEQQRAEAELRQRLEAAGAAGREKDAAREDAEARCGRLEQELCGLRGAQEELAEKLSQAQKAKEEAEAQAKAAASQPAPEAGPVDPAGELEDQFRQGVAALARATAELAKERGERQRSEQRTAELNERLQALHEELKRTLQSEREGLTRISTLEEQHQQAAQALEQRTADLEQEQAERQLLQENLDKAKEVNAQLRKDLAFFEETNKKFGGSRDELQSRLAESLGAVRDSEGRVQQEKAERQRLAQTIETMQHKLQDEARKRAALEQELQGVRDALHNAELKLQTETAERQRLGEALDSVQRHSYSGSERDLEMSRLQSALEAEQVERKRQESELALLRHRAWDAVHGARALRTSLRRQIRTPLDSLAQSTRSLLELELGEAQKRLAEAVLQDALLVQTRLRDPEVGHAEIAEATASAPAAAPASTPPATA